MPPDPSDGSRDSLGLAPDKHTDAAAGNGANRAAEIKEAQIKRAKEIIAGRQRPEPLVPKPGVNEFLEREFEGREPPVSGEARQKVLDWLNLQTHYPGCPVACFTTPEGVLTVLAFGKEEVEALLKGLSAEEAAKVVVEYPDPPIDIN